AGKLGWSSGSLPHLVDVRPDGRIDRWIIVEGSLTPTPAEPERTAARLIAPDAAKSAYAAIGQSFDRLATPAHCIQSSEFALSEDDPVNETDTLAPADEPPFMPAGRPHRRLPIPAVDAAPADRLAGRSIEVLSPFDRLSALDMLHGYLLLRHTKAFHGVSERYAQALTHKLARERLTALKADELNRSTLTGYGDEWVPELWSAQIWNRAREDNIILPLFNAVEMPSNPFFLPTEGADPAVYYVPETADEAQLTLGAANPIPDSRIGTGRVQLLARKLALRVGFSAELVEDAIVPVLTLYRQQAVQAILDSIDHVLLNGDIETGATGNINKSHAAPAATDRYLVFDGLRKLPLVTNSANGISAGGAPTLALLRQARFTMLPRYAARPADLAWIVDSATYARLLGLTEYVTVDKGGPTATAITGQIGLLDGSPVLVSPEMPLATSTGRVGASGNVTGTAICVYRPGWTVGYRRRIAVSVDYLPYTDSYQLTATVRLAFARFDNEVAAALYNITV
ncbi:MAG: phage major capsid protein, partial [Anaerolinea sp.]|nr:phage major capsid protein [Anaerolinea sp.]